MKLQNPSKYLFMFFEKGRYPKKYNAVLQNKESGRLKRIPFGHQDYEQYFDSTGLNVYSNRNHRDKKRRANYRKRHAKTAKNKFSSSWFSWYYLW